MALNPRQMLGLGNARPSMRYQQLNQSFQSDPRRILGQALMQQGASTAPVRTPLQGLGRLSSALVGAYLQRKAGDAQVERENQYSSQLANALTGLGKDVPSAITTLGQVPGMEIPAITAAANYQTTVAGRTPKNTRRDMTSAEVAATGRDPSLGVYQIDTQGAIFPPSGSQVSGDISNRFDQINEVIRLNQKESLTPQEAMRLDLFTKDLARSRPVVVPDGAGGTVTVMQPGLDVSSITGGQTVTGDAALRGDPAAGATGGGDVAGIPGGTIVGEKPDQLTTQESEFVADAASASADLQTVIDIMFNGDLTGGEYNQSVAIASGTGVGRAASGDAQRLFDALNNLVDLRLRQRTGATANQEEVENYLSAVLPGLTTRPDTQRARVERLITELNQKIKAFKGGRNIPGLSVITIPETAADDSDEFEF
jgi:hypothetical protein